MEEKKSGKGGFVVVIVILLLICGLMGTFICLNWEKIFDKDSTVVSSTKQKNNDIKGKTSTKEELDINSALVQGLYDTFKDSTCYMNVNGLNSDNKVRLRVAYDNISRINIGSSSCSELPATNDLGGSCGTGHTTHTITAKVLENKYHELFGTDSEFKNESFGTGHTADPQCYSMTYFADKGLYAEYNCEGGGTCATSKQTLVSAYKESDKLYIITDYKNEYEYGDTVKKVIYQFKKDNILGNYVYEKGTME